MHTSIVIVTIWRVSNWAKISYNNKTRAKITHCLKHKFWTINFSNVRIANFFCDMMLQYVALVTCINLYQTTWAAQPSFRLFFTVFTGPWHHLVHRRLRLGSNSWLCIPWWNFSPGNTCDHDLLNIILHKNIQQQHIYTRHISA